MKLSRNGFCVLMTKHILATLKVYQQTVPKNVNGSNWTNSDGLSRLTWT
jgi:hypothetical protein